jgi:D-sedoheptulose 7-phosphate isomerase
MPMVSQPIAMLPLPEWSPEALTAKYLETLRETLARVDLGAVARVTQSLREARDSGSHIFIAGNGGSAATASHWVNDLGKATKRSGRAAMRVMGLSDNVSWLTALANDEGYERVFAGQLENFAEPGDVLVVISASGNSPNLIEAVKLAAARGMRTVALLGFDGGKLKTLVDDVIWIASEKGAYELVEDVHSVLCHAITRNLVADR